MEVDVPPGASPNVTVPISSAVEASAKLNVSTLVEVDATTAVRSSAWSPHCGLLALLAADGTVQVWSRRGEPGSTQPMRQMTKFQVFRPAVGVEFGACQGSLCWAPSGLGSQLAVSCWVEAAPGRDAECGNPASGADVEQLLEEGDVGVWAPQSGDSACPGELRAGGAVPCWRRRALLRVPGASEGEAFPPPWKEGSSSAWRRVLAMEFVQLEQDPLSLSLVAVTAEGKALVYRSEDSILWTPTWLLQDEVCLVPQAVLSPMRANLASAVLAPLLRSQEHSGAHMAPPERPTAAIAIAVNRAPHLPMTDPMAPDAKVWAYSAQYMRWHVAADLMSGGSAEDVGVVHHMAWRPNVDGTAADVMALATSVGVRLLRVSHSQPPSGELLVEPIPLDANFSSPTSQVSWHWTGTRLAAASSSGEVRIWAEGAGPELVFWSTVMGAA